MPAQPANLQESIILSLDDLLNYISSVFQYVGDFITGVVNNLKGLLTTFITTLQTYIANIINTLTQAISNLYAHFETLLTNFITRIQGFFQQITDWIYGLIGPILNQIQTMVNSVLGFLNQAFGYVVTQLEYYINTALNYIVLAFHALFDPIAPFVNQAITAVKNFITDAFNGIVAAKDAVIAGIEAAWNELITSATDLINSIQTGLPEVVSGFQAAGTALADRLIEISDQFGAPIVDEIKKYIEPFTAALDDNELDNVYQAINQALSANTLDLGDRQQANAFFNSIMPTSRLGRAAFHGVIAPLLVMGVYKGVVDANAQVILQEFATQYHYALLGPADVALALHRGELNLESAKDIIVRQGFSPGNAQIMLDNSLSVPPVGELMAMRNRGTLNVGEFQEALKRLGIDPQFIAGYNDLIDVIPSIQDLIVMAVKGAFSQDEISKFGLAQDFPDDITEWGEKQGLSKEWMLRYWQAHWNLPSPTQGFEMLHRGVIDQDTLGVLLKALDIVPFWREKLTQISYNVLTRVDVRRLHQLGMLTRTELVQAHKDMGYNPADAEKLADFTEELNRGKPGEADEELGRLSRTNVVNFYQDGTITRERAIALLHNIGYTVDAATLFIDTADFEAERVQRAAEIEFIIASSVAGVLTFDEALDKLGSLHLSPTELDRASAKLLREQSKQIKLPTVEQGTNMFNAKVINEAQFGDLLRRLGYRAQWAQAFIDLAKKKLVTN